jgi:hypothetical protein
MITISEYTPVAAENLIKCYEKEGIKVDDEVKKQNELHQEMILFEKFVQYGYLHYNQKMFCDGNLLCYGDEVMILVSYDIPNFIKFLNRLTGQPEKLIIEKFISYLMILE